MDVHTSFNVMIQFKHPRFPRNVLMITTWFPFFLPAIRKEPKKLHPGRRITGLPRPYEGFDMTGKMVG